MAATVSLLSVIVGAAVARMAEQLSAHMPARTEVLETVAGILLLGGFAAIGCALPSML